MFALKAILWVLAAPFRLLGLFVRVLSFVLTPIAKPGSIYAGLAAAGSWWISAAWAKDIMHMDQGVQFTKLISEFSANANIYAAVLSGISVLLMCFIDDSANSVSQFDMSDVRREIRQLRRELAVLKAQGESVSTSSESDIGERDSN